MNVLRRKAWSPWTAGIVVGLLQIPALLVIASPLGVSSSYVSLSGYIASLFDQDILQSDYFEKYMTSLKYAWQGSMVIGIALGAFISKKLSGARRDSFSPIWRRALKLQTLTSRSILAFLGGFIMLFGGALGRRLHQRARPVRGRSACGQLNPGHRFLLHWRGPRGEPLQKSLTGERIS